MFSSYSKSINAFFDLNSVNFSGYFLRISLFNTSSSFTIVYFLISSTNSSISIDFLSFLNPFSSNFFMSSYSNIGLTFIISIPFVLIGTVVIIKSTLLKSSIS